MKIALIAFTKAGGNTCRKIGAGLSNKGHDCMAFSKGSFDGYPGILPIESSLDQWAKAAFSQQDALVFIGACGIAVRAIAPYIKDKTSDPAVLVVDEKGKFAISLLSGHLGGANDLAKEIAGMIGAEPVITSATDLNHKFAVDDWAKKNRLQITDRRKAKEISAALLNGAFIGVVSDSPIKGEVPEQLIYQREGPNAKEEQGTPDLYQEGDKIKIGFRVSIYEKPIPFSSTLLLVPKTVTAGIGCRKGVSKEKLLAAFYQVLSEQNLSVYAVEKLCSIDIKKEETALRQLADQLGVPLRFFSADELGEVSGAFTSSDFVSRITGVDNVCERAAVLGSQGKLIVEKQSMDGITIAIAVREEEYQWR